MIPFFKKLSLWMGAMIGVIIILILMDIIVLAYPGPFFKGKKQYGTITVYSEQPITRKTDSLLSEVLLRLEKVPIYDTDEHYNLCLCASQEKFTSFARLTVRANRIMGFSLLGSGFVNIDFIKELGHRTGGKPKYLTREGSIVHVATHELMHGIITDYYGSLAARSLPEWKIEGYCEYGVNQYVAPRDSGYSIPERISIYLDDAMWNRTAEIHRPHYLWGLMMEYLINVRGLSFEQVMADGVSRQQVYREMMDWKKSIRDRPEPSPTRQTATQGQ